MSLFRVCEDKKTEVMCWFILHLAWFEEPRLAYFTQMRPVPSPSGPSGAPARSCSPNSSSALPSLFVYSHTEPVMRPGPSPSSSKPTHHLITSSTWWAHSSALFIYIFIHSATALRVSVFNIVGETWLLPLNAEITGAFFLSSSPLHFSRVAPRGRNIFISPCARSFKTFTPAVWKIFLIFLPHGVEKSP